MNLLNRTLINGTSAHCHTDRDRYKDKKPNIYI